MSERPNVRGEAPDPAETGVDVQPVATEALPVPSEPAAGDATVTPCSSSAT